jgi:hypothetical protein
MQRKEHLADLSPVLHRSQPGTLAPSGVAHHARARRLAPSLADIAITAEEHTDLKLGDLSAQLDCLREQNDSLRKILKDVA